MNNDNLNHIIEKILQIEDRKELIQELQKQIKENPMLAGRIMRILTSHLNQK